MFRDSTIICLAGSAVHEMGTARMGRDPKTSVLNGFNQMHECEKCFHYRWQLYDFFCLAKSFTDLYGLTARACDFAVNEIKKGSL